jgi:hypothetical protein
MAQQLKAEPSVKNYIAISHVPPYDADFDKNLEIPYKNLFSSTQGFLASLHGHLHDENDHYPYEDGVRYINSNCFKKRIFIQLDIIDGKIIKTMVDF